MKIFRDEYGQASTIPGADLSLYLKDFAGPALTADLPIVPIRVGAATLTRILCEAEEEEFARVGRLEERLNYTRNLGPSPDTLVPVATPPRQRRRRIRPMLNFDDKPESFSEGSTQNHFKAQRDDDHGGHNQGEGHA